MELVVSIQGVILHVEFHKDIAIMIRFFVSDASFFDTFGLEKQWSLFWWEIIARPFCP